MLSLFRLPLLVMSCVVCWTPLVAAERPAKVDGGPRAQAGAEGQRPAENREAPSADKDARTKRGTPPGTAKHASIAQQRAGKQTLMIHYLWKAHARASIEVRLAPGERAEKVLVSPLHFYSDYFKGAAEEKFYRCLDGADRGATDSYRKDKTDFKIVAERNPLGHPAAVVFPINPKAPRDREHEDDWSRPIIIFPLLAPWAIDDRTLSLDLPRDVSYQAESDELEKRLQAFSRPGKLHVWFLRGDKVLWEEQLDWPGQ